MRERFPAAVHRGNWTSSASSPKWRSCGGPYWTRQGENAEAAQTRTVASGIVTAANVWGLGFRREFADTVWITIWIDRIAQGLSGLRSEAGSTVGGPFPWRSGGDAGLSDAAG